MITNSPTKRNLSDITVTNVSPSFIPRVLPTRWRRKPAGIDAERNYAIIQLCFAILYGNGKGKGRLHKINLKYSKRKLNKRN